MGLPRTLWFTGQGRKEQLRIAEASLSRLKSQRLTRVLSCQGDTQVRSRQVRQGPVEISLDAF